jgi:hypothetical protein
MELKRMMRSLGKGSMKNKLKIGIKGIGHQWA